MSNKVNLLALMAMVSLLCAATARAGIIELQFTGIDIEYDGAMIADTTGGGADPLTTLVILEDAVVTAGSPFTSDIAIDLEIPGVMGIDAAGDQVVSDPGGSLDLMLPGGDFLALTLEEVTVTYVSTTFVQFSFGASVAGVDGQSLPGGLVLGDPVSVSFSTTVNSLSTSGGLVTAFTASGTGEIEDRIPEPTAVLLLGVAGLLAGCTRRKRS